MDKMMIRYDPFAVFTWGRADMTPGEVYDAFGEYGELWEVTIQDDDPKVVQEDPELGQLLRYRLETSKQVETLSHLPGINGGAVRYSELHK